MYMYIFNPMVAMVTIAKELNVGNNKVPGNTYCLVIQAEDVWRKKMKAAGGNTPTPRKNMPV